MTSRRSAPVGMATRSRSTASGIARLQARAPAPARVSAWNISVPCDIWSNRLSRSHPYRPHWQRSEELPHWGYTKFTQPTLSLPWRKISLAGDFTAPADGLSTGAVANPEGLVTADLQVRVIALEDETTSLRMVILTSRRKTPIVPRNWRSSALPSGS
jgi:hypothetical protein